MIKTRKHKSDLVITFATLVLLILGLIIIYAIGPMRANTTNAAYGTDYSSDYFFVRQLISVGLSIGLYFFFFKFVKYDWLKKYSKWILIIGIAASVLLWILASVGSSLATCELGECRWFNLFGVSFQPAELLKFCVIVYFADFFARKKEEGTRGGLSFWVPSLVVLGISLALVVIAQGDLGSGVSLIVIYFVMSLVAGVSMKEYWIIVAMIVVAGVIAIVISPTRIARVETWWSIINGSGGTDATYHIENALLAIGTGGLFGVGIGNSVQATGYLPESINDSIFAVMGETFGFVGLIVILALFALLLIRIVKVAERTAETDNRLYVIGVFAWILTQVVVNIMAMTGLIPVTGITLPLVSYGGSSMICVVVAIALVAQLSCYTGREVIKENENISSRRRVRGTHHSSSVSRS